MCICCSRICSFKMRCSCEKCLNKQKLIFELYFIYFVSFNIYRSVLAGIRNLLKQGSVQKVYNGLQGY